jgi:orotate phosphoribosyltransferase
MQLREPAAMQQATIEQLFERSDALLTGHFLLTSGRHAARYLEKFFVLQHPAFTVEICRRFAAALAGYDPTIVVGPTTGGVLLAAETARQLEPLVGHPVRGVFAERVDAGGRALRRGWTIEPDERVVVVDDILTTGLSLIETIDAVRAAGAEPLAAAVIVDRATSPVEAGIPIHALGKIEIDSWPATDCPLCAAGSSPRKPGSG